MSERIYLSSPDITQAEEDGVVAAIRSGWVAPLGPEVDAFEQELASYTRRKHAVALSSGSAALHLALLGVGARPGTVVVTSTMTFAATANSVTYTGAEPVFIDADDSGNMDPDLLAHAVSDLQGKGVEVAAVLPVDLLGKIADYNRIEQVLAKTGIPLVADAAESLGAVRDGQAAGASGIASAVSFNGNKIMTTSGGGMLLTDDAATADRARYLATQARQPVVHYEHEDIGYNYRLSNLLAGLGRAQLRRLPAMIERRRGWRLRYRELFGRFEGTSIFGGADGADGGVDHDNFWLTSVLVDESVSGWSATGLREHLAAANIEARPLWKPMHLQPVFRESTSYLNGTSERFFAQGISLPSGSALRDDQFDVICRTIADYVEGARA
ncbi:DegT/DnrJ/EryC1/StrS family aminotransferase [Georgenia subflava]|uniref:Aminotransferase class I/II-fold pyridoxal phosphate-dependent enzyme n=1 Tax=Georgenia subflava TaxID=1622177 RepID=A0A6N7EM57_9MICO|nr:aminotransferase class I/II-fold pyridoxal phosphate-dependent enzyme [Georgenia subflava]MPV37605.1 aminotransferase class I/II-fold pyridoxal phosphate-dependent enzyme [Georgenia subflava]